MMEHEPMYDDWIAHRRGAKPSRELADRIMAAVQERDVERPSHRRLADRVNESRPARWAACLAALLIGSLPFWVVAYVSQSPVL